MRRRRFLTAAACATLGPLAGGRRLLGQEAAASAAETAGYDVEGLARMLDQGVAAGMAALRSEYAEEVDALSAADGQQFAKYASAFLSQAQPVLGTPVVGDAVLDGLMEAPAPEVVHNAPGPAVYYINGMFTSRKLAREEARHVARRFGGRRRVELLYNAGTDPRVDAERAANDVDEAYRDRVWPLYLYGLLTGGSLRSLAQNMLFGQSALQHNPTTRQVARLLHDHPQSCISIIGYSQGALIVRNALYTLAVLGKEDFVTKHVAFVAPGLPINDNEVWPVPRKFTPLERPNDPVPAVLGLRSRDVSWRELGLAHHQFFEDGYVKQITDAMLCPEPV